MAVIQGPVEEKDQPKLVSLVCPYCGREGRTTMPPPKEVQIAELEFSHECGYPWVFKVVTR